MRVFTPLKDRAVALLWSGQLLSCVGDEINKVALAWLGTQLLGLRAGYVAALYAATSFLLALSGGRWAERWSRGPTMIGADLVRALAVFALPVTAALGPPLLWVLLATVTVTACASTFFEPALRASLPELAPAPELLGPTTALMETTARAARLVGPLLVAALGEALPMIHFFTLDGVTFLLSALSVAAVLRVRRGLQPKEESAKTSAPRQPVLRLVGAEPRLSWILVTGTLATGAWLLVLPTGMALLVRERLPDDVRALGLLIGAYGVGNLASNLVLGSSPLRAPHRLVFGGRLVCGLGFLAMALAPTLPWMMVAAAVAATGGPATDLGFLTLTQSRFAPTEAARVYRLVLATSWAGALGVFAVSPTLFRVLGVVETLGWAAVALAATGAVGLLRFRQSPAAASTF